MKRLKKLKIKIYTYGQKNKSNFRIVNIKQEKSYSEFDVKVNLPNKKDNVNKIKIPLLGIHNDKKFVAALAIAFTIGITPQKIKEGLKILKGFKEDLIKYSHIMVLAFMMIMLIILQKLNLS